MPGQIMPGRNSVGVAFWFFWYHLGLLAFMRRGKESGQILN
jgi:hypothetical protein